jgi:hypothetical protein
MAETTAKERVEKELEELNDKMTKLSSFLYGTAILTMSLSEEMTYQMETQLYSMQQYAKCLQKRLRIWGKTDKELREINEAKILG